MLLQDSQWADSSPLVMAEKSVCGQGDGPDGLPVLTGLARVWILQTWSLDRWKKILYGKGLATVLFETTSNLGRTVLVVVLLIYIYWANSAVQGEGSSWGWRAEKGPGRDFPANSVYVSGRKKREKNRKTLLCILATFKVIWWCRLLQCIFLNHISHWCLQRRNLK